MSKSKNIISKLTSAFILTIMLIILTLGISGLYYLKELGIFSITAESLTPITNWQPQDNTVIYDRNNKKIAEFFSSYHVYIPFSELPKKLQQAIVAIEDKNFWQHPGIDLKAIFRAALIYLKGSKSKQGASTITQQIVRHFLLPKEKTFSRKIKEIFLALKLEKLIDKQTILEIYTNALFMGNGAYGVGAAAKRFFNKNINDLDLHECALIAGLFQSPSRYNPHKNPRLAKTRQIAVLWAMAQAGLISYAEAKEWGQKPLNYQSYQPLYGINAPYFVDYIHNEAQAILKQKNIKNKGLKIYTTLDPALQQFAEKAINNASQTLDSFAKEGTPIRLANGKMYLPPIETALIATDPKNGEILAMVGGRNYQQSKFNRAVDAMRQPGSGFKPIVYSLALSVGLKWSDMIFVSPITVAGNYRPRTASEDYMTETTLLRAFYRSMNAPTMEIGEKIGLSSIIEHAQKLGMSTPIKQEFGSILGSSETTLLDMAKVYGTFANNGIKTELSAITKIVDQDDTTIYERKTITQEQALSPEINFLMVEGLRNVLIRGTGHKAHKLAHIAAGKTGTTNGGKDNWFNGFTSNLTTIVWVGTDASTSLSDQAQGATLALPIWQEFMENAITIRKTESFIRPKGVISMRIHPEFGYPYDSGILMWFVDNNMPSKDNRYVNDLNNAASFRDPFAKHHQQ